MILHQESLSVYLLERYHENRKRSKQLFTLVQKALYERPLLRRMPFIFYLGHLPVFSYVTLARAFELEPIDEELEALFVRGIDPPDDATAEKLQPSRWPQLARVESYSTKADQAIEAILIQADGHTSTHPMLECNEALFAIIEHEQMHQETLLYLIGCLDDSKKTLPQPSIERSKSAEQISQKVHVAAGMATLGAVRGSLPFGWDNEYEELATFVDAFWVESLPITNRAYLAYVEAGGTAPMHWFKDQTGWRIRTPLGARALPLEWPAYVSPDEAMLYASRHQARLITEAEYHRVAFHTPDGEERSFPWGNVEPHPRYGNFGFRRLLPEDVGSSPAGSSSWSVQELMGNGWEITSTRFRPLPGFRPMASYPEYSQDFFDDRHYVVKGASPATATGLLRRSLRNWFFHDYRYAFTKFRLAYTHG